MEPITKENFTRVSGYDSNGNSRYYCSFLLFSAEGEPPISYQTALYRASFIGGKKYNTKNYRGGIVFQSSSPETLAERINTLLEKREWEVTKVIFRKWKKGGGVIALFPELSASTKPEEECLSYELVGEHGAANISQVMKASFEASSKESAPLREVLEEKGYNLREVKRQCVQDKEERIASVKG